MIVYTCEKKQGPQPRHFLLSLCVVALFSAGLLGVLPQSGSTYAAQIPNQGVLAAQANHLSDADTAMELGRLTASDAGGEFGYTVAIDGETIVVGAQGDDEQAGNAGAVYVFLRPGSGWTDGTETAKLTASDAAIGDGLGSWVAISGNTIVAGASGEGNYGAAYVFVKPPGGWSDGMETAKLTPSDAAVGAEFGISVGVSGDSIVVGARGDDENGGNSGSAYVFVQRPGGWATGTETAKLTASDGEEMDLFGNSVAIDGDTIVAGAHGDDDQAFAAGAAYVFTRPTGGWTTGTETAKLTASDGAEQDFFGIFLTVNDDTAVIGASADDVGGNDNQGSAYVFERPGGGWASGTETAKLTASDGAWNDEFGKAVTVSGDVVVVGAHWDDWGGGSIFDEGSAYVYVKPVGDWADATETAKLTASDGEPGDEFGTSVALDGDTLVVGAYGDPIEFQPGFGSAYVYALVETPDAHFLYLPVVLK
jgi:hypothetical protein